MIEESKKWGIYLRENQKHHKTIDGYRKNRITNLIRKYGIDIVDDFFMVRENYAIDLTIIGKKYGFSREYARQCFRLFHGEPYRPFQANKAMKARRDTACVHDPRRKVAEFNDGSIRDGAKAELLFMNECKNRGFTVEAPCKPDFDIVVNGYNVDVKMRNNSNKTSERCYYYRFSISIKQKKQCAFIAVYPKPEEVFYIIPITDIIGREIYIPTFKGKTPGWKPKYLKYKNAFDLLIK